MDIPVIAPTSIRVLTILEAETVNAVAKNVLDFCRAAGVYHQHASGSPPIDVSIVTFDRSQTGNPRGVSCNEFVNVARGLGITIDVVPERFRFDTRVMAALKRLVAHYVPDLIVTHNVKSHFLTRICGLNRHRPWVAFHHGYTSTDLKMGLYNQLDRWSLAGADRVVTVCGHFALQLQHRGIPAERIVVRHNSVGPLLLARERDICDVRERCAGENGNRLILAIGRLSREKGHVDLVSAFAVLRSLKPGIRAKLVIVGEGPERRAIEAAVRAHGLRDDVRLEGFIRDVTPYYAAADVFVLPSHSEGSPYVLLEAMRAGLPIVATVVGGVPEILTDGENGLLVAPHDTKCLAAAISCVLGDRELAKRIAANAASLVSAHYSLETYVRSVSDIYRSLACQATTPHLQMV